MRNILSESYGQIYKVKAKKVFNVTSTKLHNLLAKIRTRMRADLRY